MTMGYQGVMNYMFYLARESTSDLVMAKLFQREGGMPQLKLDRQLEFSRDALQPPFRF